MRLARVLASLLLLQSCAEGDPEAAAYDNLEGIYEIASVVRYPERCEPSGEGQQTPDFSSYWVAYKVSHGVPDLQLHAHGCRSIDRCRALAQDVQEDGRLDSTRYLDFTRHVYSRVSDEGVVEGVGVTLVGVVADDCRLVLEQTSVATGQDETLFQSRERLGAEYAPEADNTCSTRDDLSAEWRSWTTQPCLGFEVIHARFAERL